MGYQNPSMKLLVAIPCLNEDKTIRSVIDQIPRDIPEIDEVTVLVVDDGSTDHSCEEATAAGAQVISHGHNRGLGSAFQTALAYATRRGFDVMVNIDADGQFDPTEIVKLIHPITAGTAQMVTASRFLDEQRVSGMPWIKRWGNRRMAAIVSHLSGREFHDVSCGFRAYSREAMLHLNLHGKFTYTHETFLDLSFKDLAIQEIPLSVRYFPDRDSRIAASIPSYALRTCSILLQAYRDYHPLQFFWGLASVLLIIGMGFGINLLTHYLRFGFFTGQIWSGFVGAVFASAALVLFVLGVVADMLDRQRRNQERILYILKSHESSNANAPIHADAPEE
jgi:glycosyltransferase involved in cell wall biosynthesis